MRRVRGAVVVLAMLVAGLWVSPSAWAAAKPDLVMKALFVAPDPYYGQLQHVVMEPDGTSDVFVGYVLKNVGKATAKDIELRVTFESQTGMLWNVPKVKPGDKKRGSDSVELPLSTLGLQPLELCADPLNKIAEVDESNNCKVLGAVRVLARRWRVERFSHKQTDSYGAVGTMATEDLAFTYDGPASKDGAFRYQVEGKLKWTLSGGSPCSWSATEEWSHAPWAMTDGQGNALSVFDISPTLTTYTAIVTEPHETVTTTLTCPGPYVQTFEQGVSGLATHWSNTALPAMNPDDTDLDVNVIEYPGPGATWEWDWRFIADIP